MKAPATRAWMAGMFACSVAACQTPAPPTKAKPVVPARLPAEAEATLDAVISGCRQGKVSLIWPALSASLKRRLDARADAERSKGAAHLAEHYRYVDHPGGFDGSALLAGALEGELERHPCPHADLWRRVDVELRGTRSFVSYQHPDGRTQVLALEQAEANWFVDDFAAVPPSVADDAAER